MVATSAVLVIFTPIAVVIYANAAIENIAKHESVDIVMAAIVGAAGLAPC